MEVIPVFDTLPAQPAGEPPRVLPETVPPVPAPRARSGMPPASARVPADAYPLDATGWGTGGWPWI